jgi:predicted permease
MNGCRSILTRLRTLLSRRPSEDDFDEEVSGHLSLLADRFVRRGMTTEDAWSEARRQFGNDRQLKEVRYEMSSFVWLETLVQDLRFALRALRRSPSVTSAIVLTLMLGIGANAVLFSVVYATLFRPLPYRESDRLVFMTEESAGQSTMSAPDLEFWRDHSSSFEAVAGFNAADADVNIDGESIPARTVYFFGSFEPVFGVSPRIGRGFLPEEAEIRASGEPRRVALISDRLFRQRFGGDPSILGKSISLFAFPVTVVGVLPPDFRFAPPGPTGPPREMDLMVNDQFTFSPRWIPGSGFGPPVQAVGRLKPGITLEKARAEIEIVRASLNLQGRIQNPAYNAKRSLMMVPFQNRVTGSSRLGLLMLWSAVGFVLLVACANVANLLLARAAARSRETAVRVAMGASRTRLIRQFFTESLLVALVGGAAGLVLASWVIRLITIFGPTEIPQLADAKLNLDVLLFGFVACAFTGILSGMAPAIQGSRSDPGESLKQGGRTTGRARHRLHGLLIVSELALALMLSCGAGLMLKSLWLMRSRGAAFAPERVLTTFLNARNIQSGGQQESFLAGLQSQLESLPGVRAAAVIGGGSAYFQFIGLPPLPNQLLFEVAPVTPHYPVAAGVHLITGRWLGDQDSAGAPLVTVVNETAAHLYSVLYPAAGSIVGKQIENANRPLRYTIIGVISDFPQRPDATQAPQIFLSHWQSPFNGSGTVLMRTSSDPADLIVPMQRVIRQMPRVTLRRVETLEGRMTATIAPRRFQAALLTIFAGLSLILATVGVYGVLSYSVIERTHEIGVCMALGAKPSDILGVIVGRAIRLAAAGISLGLFASLCLARFIGSLLYVVTPSDPVSYATVSLLLMVVAVLAAYVPARRAACVDPTIALRYD